MDHHHLRLPACAALFFLNLSAATLCLAAEPTPTEAIARVGITSGLAVHVPATDGVWESACATDGRWLVQGLASDASAVALARQRITSDKRTGMASVRLNESAPTLPYADNLVSILVVDADALGKVAPSAEECSRVVHPEGLIAVRRNGVWTTSVKAMPAAFGEWTHLNGGPDGNNRSPDMAVGPSTSLRWIAAMGGGHEAPTSNGVRVGSGVMVNDAQLKGGSVNIAPVTLIQGRNAWNGVPRFLLQGNKDMGFFKGRPLVIGEGKLYTFLEDGVLKGGQLKGKPGPLQEIDVRSGLVTGTFEKSLPLIRKHEVPGRHLTLESNLAVTKDAIFQTGGDSLVALDPKSRAVLWTYSAGTGRAVDLPSYHAATKRVVFAEGKFGRTPGRVPKMVVEAVVAVDAANGKVVWRTPIVETGDPKFNKDGGKPLSQIACVEGRVYIFRGKSLGNENVYLSALDAMNGKPLWVREGGVSTKDPATVYPVGFDMTVIGKRIYIMADGVGTIDADTGTVLSSFTTGNARCDSPHAAGNLLLLSFGNWYDTAKDNLMRTEVVRGHCGTGTFPAYGMAYGTPSRCRCAMVLHGYMALARDQPQPDVADGGRLIAGAPAAVAPAKPADPADWPTFMGTPQRQSANSSPVAGTMKELWRVSVAPALKPKDGPLVAERLLSGAAAGTVSAPVVADGRVYVAIPFAHRVESRALDRPHTALWSFTADAPVDSPPTIYKGLCIFGGRDGSVYALDAVTGALRWRFLAAPNRNQIVAYAQCESAWPVHGAITVAADTVVAIAGYHPETDGGLRLWGLEPMTGKARWTRTINRTRNWLPGKNGKADEVSYIGSRASGGFNSNAILNSMTVSDGRMVGIPGFVFDAATGQPSTDVRPANVKKDEPSPFPDAVDARMTFDLRFNERPPERSTTFADFSGPGHHQGTWSLTFPETSFRCDAHHVVWRDKDVFAVGNGQWAGMGQLSFFDGTVKTKDPKPRWKAIGNQREITALALAQNVLVVGRGPVLSPLGEASTSGKIELLKLDDGTVQQTLDLPSTPLENGIALARGRIVVTCLDGSLVCFGP